MQQDLPKNEIDEMANEGWTQMQGLLHQHGLEEKRRPLFYYVFRIGGIAACLLAFLFIYQNFIHLPGKPGKIFLSGDRQTVKDNALKNAVSLFPLNGNKQNKNAPAAVISNTHNVSRQKTVTYSGHRRIFNTKFVFPQAQIRRWDSLTLTALSLKMPPRGKIMVTPLLPSQKIYLTPPLHTGNSNEQPTNDPKKKPLQIFAGVGSNITLQNNIDQKLSLSTLNIHPSIRLVIPLNNRLSLHTGLYAMSTLHGKNENAKEKEEVNNLGANLYYKINSTSLIKASYFELPAVINYKLKENWSLGAGLKISRLYQFSVKEKEESYDFGGNLVETNELRYAVNTMAPPPLNNKVSLKKWEPGLVLETNLHKGKFLFSAGCVYETGKAIKIYQPNGNTHHFRNKYFKLGIQYQIK